ncbi:unnamed protein product [Ectocarpus sp. 4 AP-2014]
MPEAEAQARDVRQGTLGASRQRRLLQFQARRYPTRGNGLESQRRPWTPKKLYSKSARTPRFGSPSLKPTEPRLEKTLLGVGGGQRDGTGLLEKRNELFYLSPTASFPTFPHTGTQSINLNRNLIRDFFASPKGLVKCAVVGGEVHATLKDKSPYSGWNGSGEGKRADHGGVPGVGPIGVSRLPPQHNRPSEKQNH